MSEKFGESVKKGSWFIASLVLVFSLVMFFFSPVEARGTFAYLAAGSLFMLLSALGYKSAIRLSGWFEKGPQSDEIVVELSPDYKVEVELDKTPGKKLGTKGHGEASIRWPRGSIVVSKSKSDKKSV